MVPPDRSSWSWKDEAELEWSVEQGRFTGEQAAEIREEGERAVTRLLADAGGVYSRWQTWAPNPVWPLPHFPEDWDRLEASMITD